MKGKKIKIARLKRTVGQIQAGSWLPADADTAIKRYAEDLAAAGLPDREIARAFFYAEKYGLEAMNGDGNSCFAFGEPSCKDWDCLNPEHQTREASVGDN